MNFPDDSHIFDEDSYKNEKSMSNVSNHNRKSDAILIDANFSNDPLFSNEILNKSEESTSEVSNPYNVISNDFCLDNIFVCGRILSHYETQILCELKRTFRMIPYQ
ncbi:unnamed protein product, partial [Schistosoma mattheei]